MSNTQRLIKKKIHTQKAMRERWEVDSMTGNCVVCILEGKGFERI